MSTTETSEYIPWSASMIRDTKFGQARRGKGLDPDEVYAFVNRVADEIAWLHGQLEDRDTQLQLAQAGVELAITGEAQAIDVYATLDEQALSIRMNAQDEANRIVAEAEQQAEDIVTAAEEHAASMAVEPELDDSPEQDDPPKRERTAFEMADQLPERIAQWEATGTDLVNDAMRLAKIAQESMQRIAKSFETIHQGLAAGDGRAQLGAAQSIPGEGGQPVPTPDPPG